MKLTETNQWLRGLNLDTHPIAVTNKDLTSALNATMITMQGDEMVLQNDMGNARVESAYLPAGYVPVGMQEFGGIVYVASYNPLTHQSQIGSFPSPERNISSDEEGAPTTALDIFTKGCDKEDYKLTDCIKKLKLTANPLRPGDKYSIDMINWDEFRQLVEYVDLGVYDLKLAVIDDGGNLVDIPHSEITANYYYNFSEQNITLVPTPPEEPDENIHSTFIRCYDPATNESQKDVLYNIYKGKLVGDLYIVLSLTLPLTNESYITGDFKNGIYSVEIHTPEYYVYKSDTGDAVVFSSEDPEYEFLGEIITNTDLISIKPVVKETWEYYISHSKNTDTLMDASIIKFDLIKFDSAWELSKDENPTKYQRTGTYKSNKITVKVVREFAENLPWNSDRYDCDKPMYLRNVLKNGEILATCEHKSYAVTYENNQEIRYYEFDENLEVETLSYSYNTKPSKSEYNISDVFIISDSDLNDDNLLNKFAASGKTVIMKVKSKTSDTNNANTTDSNAVFRLNGVKLIEQSKATTIISEYEIATKIEGTTIRNLPAEGSPQALPILISERKGTLEYTITPKFALVECKPLIEKLKLSGTYDLSRLATNTGDVAVVPYYNSVDLLLYLNINAQFYLKTGYSVKSAQLAFKDIIANKFSIKKENGEYELTQSGDITIEDCTVDLPYRNSYSGNYIVTIPVISSDIDSYKKIYYFSGNVSEEVNLKDIKPYIKRENDNDEEKFEYKMYLTSDLITDSVYDATLKFTLEPAVNDLELPVSNPFAIYTYPEGEGVYPKETGSIVLTLNIILNSVSIDSNNYNQFITQLLRGSDYPDELIINYNYSSTEVYKTNLSVPKAFSLSNQVIEKPFPITNKQTAISSVSNTGNNRKVTYTGIKYVHMLEKDPTITGSERKFISVLGLNNVEIFQEGDELYSAMNLWMTTRYVDKNSSNSCTEGSGRHHYFTHTIGSHLEKVKKTNNGVESEQDGWVLSDISHSGHDRSAYKDGLDSNKLYCMLGAVGKYHSLENTKAGYIAVVLLNKAVCYLKDEEQTNSGNWTSDNLAPDGYTIAKIPLHDNWSNVVLPHSLSPETATVSLPNFKVTPEGTLDFVHEEDVTIQTKMFYKQQDVCNLDSFTSDNPYTSDNEYKAPKYFSIIKSFTDGQYQLTKPVLVYKTFKSRETLPEYETLFTPNDTSIVCEGFVCKNDSELTIDMSNGLPIIVNSSGVCLIKEGQARRLKYLTFKMSGSDPFILFVKPNGALLGRLPTAINGCGKKKVPDDVSSPIYYTDNKTFFECYD